MWSFLCQGAQRWSRETRREQARKARPDDQEPRTENEDEDDEDESEGQVKAADEDNDKSKDEHEDEGRRG